MAMYNTKYPNNIRTVSGLNVAVFDNDVVLAVNTSGGPCSINLNAIPSGFWSTQWKLYVYDASNNASVNNITINAGSGQTINNSSSIVLSSNNAGVVISIINNNSFIATLNSSSGFNITNAANVGTGAEVFKNLTGSVLNFRTLTQGSNISITQNTNELLISTITGGVIFLLKDTLDTLINNSNLKPGQWYFVTNPLNADGVLLKGAYNNQKTTLNASGYYFNADYQGVGNYSSVSGFNTQVGMWNINFPFTSLVIGDVCIYENLHYVSLTGFDINVPPSLDTTNWQVLPKTATNGYIVAFDSVLYNIDTNRIIYRADKRGNEVEDYTDGKANNSLRLFQWGRDVVRNNKVLSDSILLANQSYCSFENNTLYSSAIEDNSPNGSPGSYSFNFLQNSSIVCTFLNRGIVQRNVLTSNSSIAADIISFGAVVSSNIISSNSYISFAAIQSATIVDNIIEQNSYLNFNALLNAGSEIISNKISNSSSIAFANGLGTGLVKCEVSANQAIMLGNLLQKITGKACTFGYSNWEIDLDLNDILIFSGSTLTIPATLSWVGIINTLNSTGKTISSIVNAPTNHEFKIQPSNNSLPNSVAFTFTAVGSAIANDTIADEVTSVGILTATARTNGTDELVFEKVGNLVGCIRKSIWQ